MLTYLIMLLPGVVAAFLFSHLSNNKKYSGYLIIYSIIFIMLSNISVRFGLYIIGVRSLKLSAMGNGFKTNYFVLEMAILLGVLALYKLMCKDSREESFTNMKKILPMLLFFVVTYCIFMPSSLFLGNIGEFSIGYQAILPIIVIISLSVSMGILVCAILLPPKGIIEHTAILLFGVALGIYLQGNFLNPDLPELDGTMIDWSLYTTSRWVSVVVWLICIVGLQIIAYKYRRKVIVFANYVSAFLSAVQVVTLFVLLLTTDQRVGVEVALTKEDEFSVGTESNVIVFVVDAMESVDFEKIIAENEQYEDSLEDFTFFPNSVSGGAYTKVALPLLLTGYEYDPTWTTYEEYLDEAWATTDLYRDMEDQGYDVRLFTDARFITNVSEEMVDNVQFVYGKRISSYYQFARCLYKLTNFYTMPLNMKEMFWFYTGDMLSLIEAKEYDEEKNMSKELAENVEKYYQFDDVQFYTDFEHSGGLDAKYQKAFRLYHLDGAHAPYTMDNDVKRVPEGETSLEQQMQGCMKIVFEYIDELKKKGLYESSTIIITADHGSHGYAYSIEQNQTFLVKMPNEKHSYNISTAPIHFRNVVATIAKGAFNDYAKYGPSVFDIGETSDVERMHTVIKEIGVRKFSELSYRNGYERFIISDDARNHDEIVHYNPYNINRIEYRIGDKISFGSSNDYAENINYRIYKENGVGIASNELTLCFELQNYNGGDLEFCFRYKDLYNDNQKMRVYTTGQKVADLACTKEGANQDNEFIIPAECIEDNTLILRMVFPNAVTPNQIDPTNLDTRILSMEFDSIWLQ